MGDEEKNATIAPSTPDLPAWLTGSWESSTEHEVHVWNPTANGAHDRVKIYDFTFLGYRFQTSSYTLRSGSETGTVVSTISGAGVCKELRDKLIQSQHDIYTAYALHEKRRGRQPSEAGFLDWCATPVQASLGSNPKFVASRLGWQFRKGNHKTGAAVDFDATYNPWVATQTPTERPVGGTLPGASTYGGELHGLAVTNPVLKASKMRAVEGYFNAVQFRFRSPDLDMREKQAGETSAQVYDRVIRVSNAITSYLQLFYPGYPKLTIPGSVKETPRSLDDTIRQMEYYRDNLPNTPEHKPLLDTIKELLANRAKLDSVRAQAQTDHENLRAVMVSGSAKVAGGSLTYGGSRDPCRGILCTRKEIVVAMRDQSLRWGAVDFGPAQSGDVMHFDLGQDAAVALSTPDPNTGGLYFVKQS